MFPKWFFYLLSNLAKCTVERPITGVKDFAAGHMHRSFQYMTDGAHGIPHMNERPPLLTVVNSYRLFPSSVSNEAIYDQVEPHPIACAEERPKP